MNLTHNECRGCGTPTVHSYYCLYCADSKDFCPDCGADLTTAAEKARLRCTPCFEGDTA